MLVKLADWYRIVDPAPIPETLERRQNAIEKIVESLLESDIESLAEAMTILTLKPNKQSEIFDKIVEHLRAEDLSLSTDQLENSLILKVVLGIAFGEIIKSSQQQNIAQYVAITLISLCNFMLSASSATLPSFHNMLIELQDIAIRYVENSATKKRNRRDLTRSNIDSTIPETITTVPEITAPLRDILKNFQNQINVLEASARIDREELDILWWAYGQTSRIFDKPFRDMSIEQATMCSAHELASIVNIPPMTNFFYLLDDVITQSGHRLSDSLSLKELISNSKDIIMDTNFVHEYSYSLASAYPTLAPVTWIVHRLIDSQGTTNWADEFSVKVGVEVDLNKTIQDWTYQIAWERIAQRVFEE